MADQRLPANPRHRDQIGAQARRDAAAIIQAAGAGRIGRHQRDGLRQAQIIRDATAWAAAIIVDG